MTRDENRREYAAKTGEDIRRAAKTFVERDPYLEPELAVFPYTNGGLFRSHTETMPAALNAEEMESGRRGEENSISDSSASPNLQNLRVKNNTPAAPAKTIYDGEAQIAATNINGYLVDAPNVFIENRGKPPAGFPTMTKGSQPTDGGNLILSPEERDEILANHPEGVLTSSVHMAWVRMVAGRLEMRYRYTPAVYNNFPWPDGEIIELSNNRIIESAVAEAPGSDASRRAAKNAEGRTTQASASTNPCESVKSVASKKSGCRSNHNSIVRPFDHSIIDSISTTAEAILSARALYPDSSLADLYDPLTMPPELRAAHAANDRAVLAAYGLSPLRHRARDRRAPLPPLCREKWEGGKGRLPRNCDENLIQNANCIKISSLL